MCGINGFINYSSVNVVNPEVLLGGMNTAIRHRGPDDSGIWSSAEDRVYLGHQRLSILDLSENGHQPMHGSGGTSIVFNGEIYNFRELRKECPGYQFNSRSDTEVLLALYQKYGYECIDRLNGMFAFGLWDGKRKKLFLARDRVGIKPLYFSTQNGIFSFSSEIRSLLRLPWNKPELDETALYDFLTYNHVAPPATIFRNIFKFHPGYMMIVDERGVERYEKYWEVDYSQRKDVAEQEAGQTIMEALRRSVSYRMVSDLPVGAFLSGGVDSSAIVATMAEQQSGPIKTYSIGFDESTGVDERVYARTIADRYKTEHYEKVITQQDLMDFLPKVVDIYDEPLADATSIPMYFIAQQARESGTVVVLTGDGADELFCGYTSWLRYKKAYPWYRLYLKLPKAVRKGLAGLYSRHEGNSIIREILARASRDQDLFWGGAGGFKESMKGEILTPEYAARMSGYDSFLQVRECRKLFDSVIVNTGITTDVDWMTFYGLKRIVPNFYLHRADRMGMAHSVELRVPFLDHNFVNMALSLPAGLKTLHNEPKYILKRALEGVLPADTLYRKKQGFCVPLQQWAGRVMLDFIEQHLRVFCRETGLFSEQGMRAQLAATRAGKGDYIFALWNFYFLIVWFRKWLL